MTALWYHKVLLRLEHIDCLNWKSPENFSSRGFLSWVGRVTGNDNNFLSRLKACLASWRKSPMPLPLSPGTVPDFRSLRAEVSLHSPTKAIVPIYFYLAPKLLDRLMKRETLLINKPKDQFVSRQSKQSSPRPLVLLSFDTSAVCNWGRFHFNVI